MRSEYVVINVSNPAICAELVVSNNIGVINNQWSAASLCK